MVDPSSSRARSGIDSRTTAVAAMPKDNPGVSPRARIIVIVGARRARGRRDGRPGRDHVNGKRWKESSRWPAPPLALDLGCRTDPEARALGGPTGSTRASGARRGASSRVTVAGGRSRRRLLRWPARACPLERLAGAPEGLARPAPPRLRELWGDGSRRRGWRRASRPPAGHHVRPTCRRRLHPDFPPGEPLFVPSFAPPPRLATCRRRASSRSAQDAPRPTRTRSSSTGSRSSGSAAALAAAAVRRSRRARSDDPRRRSPQPSAASTRASRPPRSRARPAHEALSARPRRSASTSASCCSGWPRPARRARRGQAPASRSRAKSRLAARREAKRLLAGLENV
jgi:hypothetical protein